MRNGIDLSPAAVANFVRQELASSLRSRKPYNVNLLLGGVDPVTDKPSLYWLDYLASLAPLPYAAHGYAQYAHIDIDHCRKLTNVTDTIVFPSWTSTTTQTSTSTRV